MSSSARGKSVRFDDRHLHMELRDGRVVSTPLDWYPQLQQATIAQVRNWRFICQAIGVEWPDLDYHLSIAGMLAGAGARRAA
jgi:hypothetical protein